MNPKFDADMTLQDATQRIKEIKIDSLIGWSGIAVATVGVVAIGAGLVMTVSDFFAPSPFQKYADESTKSLERLELCFDKPETCPAPQE